VPNLVTGLCRRNFLQPRRASRRASRSQHPVLERFACFGSHYRAFERPPSLKFCPCSPSRSSLSRSGLWCCSAPPCCGESGECRRAGRQRRCSSCRCLLHLVTVRCSIISPIYCCCAAFSHSWAAACDISVGRFAGAGVGLLEKIVSAHITSLKCWVAYSRPLRAYSLERRVAHAMHSMDNPRSGKISQQSGVVGQVKYRRCGLRRRGALSRRAVRLRGLSARTNQSHICSPARSSSDTCRFSCTEGR